MRRLVAYTLLSADGVAEAPEEFVDVFDDEMQEHLNSVIGTQDAVLLGRRNDDEWATFWPTSDIEPFAGFINSTPKHVATSTALRDEWDGATAIQGPVPDFVRDLKAQPGGDIGVHGSIDLTQSLVVAGLVDEPGWSSPLRWPAGVAGSSATRTRCSGCSCSGPPARRPAPSSPTTGCSTKSDGLALASPPGLADLGGSCDSRHVPARRAREATMDEHPNATILRDLAERMSSGDMEAAMSVLADDVEWHEIGRAEPTRGKEALAQRYAESVGDFQVTATTHDVVANDEHAVQLLDVTARRGDRTLEYRTAEIYHMKDGRITARWAFSDDTERIVAFFA